MRRVLVTGASGFVGSAALDALARMPIEIVAVARHIPTTSPPRVRWIAADLLDPAARERAIADAACDTCLHLAWDVGPGYWTAAANLDWLAASAMLLRTFAAHGGRRFVAAGTCAEYDWSATPGDAFREDAPRRPTTLYGTTKSALCDIADRFAAAVGLEAAWGVVFHVVGPGERPGRLLPSIVTALDRGEPAACTHGMQIQDPIDVRDLGAAFAALALCDLRGRVNLGAGAPLSVADMARRIAARCGRPDLLRLGALPPRAGEPARLVPDLTRMRDDLGFVPRHGRDASIADAIAWHRVRARSETAACA
jgi:nucleoside-diphosphate-sugar epimerase